MSVVIPIRQPSPFAQYLVHGWRLVPIPPGSKGPRGEEAVDWNTEENCIGAAGEIPEGMGAGLAHAYSKTASVDLDDLFMSSIMFAERGLNLQAFLDAPDAVQINSGRPGSGKLLYRLDTPLPSKSIKVNAKTIVEFRSATAEGLTVQDLLPGSKHPSGTTYQWAGAGSWQNLPPLPPAILAWWQELLVVPDHTPKGDPTDVNWDEVKDAIGHIPASICHEDWLEVIMGLHSTRHPEAYDLARSWSASCAEKYPGDREFNTRWRSFSTEKANGITIASVFHHAKAHGWVAPPVDVTKLFNDESAPPDILAEMFTPPPKLDPNLFPPALRDYALAVAQAVGCDPAVSLMGGLIALSTATDSRSRLILRDNNKFKVPPNLWGMTIGDSGDKKSPGSKPMFAPLGQIEKDDAVRFKMDLLRWEAEEAAYAAAKKVFLQQAGGGEQLLGMVTGGDILTGLTSVPELRAQPVPKRLVTKDSTSQKFVAMCAERPYGMLVDLDEGNGFLTRMAAQTGTDDRSTWVVSYESDNYHNDRVGSGSVFCENLSSSIYINVQPRVLRKVAQSLVDDGCLQRYIPVPLDSRHNSPGDPKVKVDSAAWEHLLLKVHALKPQTYTLSPEASELFEVWNTEADEIKNGLKLMDHSSYVVSCHSKFSGLTGRVALNFHMATDPASTVLSADTMRSAITFVRQYVSNSVIYTDENHLGQKNLSRWVAEKILDTAPKQTVTMRDLKRSAERQTEGMPDHVAEMRLRYCMDELEARQWVVITEENRKTITWAINPHLVEAFKAQREEIIRKRIEFKEKLTGIFHGKGEVE